MVIFRLKLPNGSLVSKKNVTPILLATMFVLAGYFLFQWLRGSNVTWTLIPSSASVVVTSKHLQDSSYVATDSKLDISRLPLLDIATDNLSLLNLLTADKKKLAQFLHEKSITYSFHPKSGTEWGIIMYIPIADADDISKLHDANRDQIRVLHHNFQDHKITDISDNRSRPLFSYVAKDGYLILSYYGDLIEDVIRSSTGSSEQNALQSQFSKVRDSNFGTSIYFNNSIWKTIIPILNQNKNLQEFAKNFPEYQDFHISGKNEGTQLKISALGSSIPDYYLTGWLEDGKSTPFSGHRHISLHTSYLHRMAVKDELVFKDKHQQWLKDNKSAAWSKVNELIGKQSNLWLDNMSSEIILSQLEENNSIKDGKILLMKYANYEDFRPVLKKLALSSTKDINTASDRFQGYDIFAIDIPELPAGLIGPMYQGFPRTYITYIAPYLVMSNHAQVLQNYIIDYENQLTWQHSPEMDSVLTDSKSTAQLAMVTNLRKSQSARLHGKTYNDLSAKVESIVFQCTYLDGEASAEIQLHTKKKQTRAKILNRTFLNVDIEWPVLNDLKLAVLQNPIDGSSEILITDPTNNLLRINDLKSGKPDILTQLNGPIVTDAYNVDFLNIGRRQRVLATQNELYAIDEDDSSTVIKFSMPFLSPSPITSLSLIDGGQDGSNRFIIKNAAQELFLWESVAKPIRKLTQNIKFEHIQNPVVTLNQIGNRAYIVTQGNGKIYVIDENKSVKKGFPIDILSRTISPFTWIQNPNSGQAEIVGVSASGELIKVSLDGKILSRRQLLRPEPGSEFQIKFDQNSMDWIIIRTSSSHASIISKDGDEIFTIKDIKPNVKVNYHFFGIDNRFISVQSGNYSTIFDMSGKRLGDKAIPSEMPIQLTYQPAFYKLLIFSRSEQKIQVWSVKLR